MTETRDKAIIETELRGSEQVKAGLKGVEDGLKGVSRESETTSKSTTSVEGKFASLERRLGTTAAQARQFEKDQKTINDAVAQNPSIAARAADAQAALAARYVVAGKNAEAFAKSTGLARHELINLSRQAQDVAVSLGSGQSFSTVLLQQGTQIADVFANSQGSVRGFFEQLGAGVGRVLTPMRVLAGGVLGIGSAALYISNNWTDAQRQIDQALIGIGRRSGETRQSINRFASENASAAGLSVSEARNVAIEFAKTGNIAASGLKGVGDAVRGYSILTGKDAFEATKELAGALSGDLVAAALKVDSVYGVMNAATLENIRALEAQGERAQAVQIILDRMAPANQKAAESVSFLSKAWTGLTNVLSNVSSGGSLTTERSPQENVDDLVRRRDEFPGTSIARTERGELQQFKDAGDKAEYFRQKLQEAQAALDSFNAGRATDQLEKLSTAAFGIGNAILPQIDAISKLDGAIRKMQEAQSNGVGPAKSAGMIAVLQHLKDLQQESLNATIRQAQYVQQLQAAWGGVSAQTAVTLQSLRDQLSVAQQITGAGQIHAQQQATINSLLAEGKSLEEASAIAVAQADVARASATANVERQTRAVRDQTRMIEAQGTGMEGVTAASIAYRNAIESGASQTAAASLRAATLRQHMEQAAAAARQMAQAEIDAADAADYGRYVSASGDPNMIAGGDTGGYARGRSEFAPELGPQGTLSFTIPTAAEDPAGYYGTDANLRPRMRGGVEGLDFDNILAEQRKLIEAMKEQTEATEANTAALSVTLNPLYNGRDYGIGYYHAAKGLDVIAQGPSSGDQLPFRAMVNGGERIQILTKEQQTAASNDNGKSASVMNITQNFDFRGSGDNSRRSKRQYAQSFGQSSAALR